MKPLYPYTNASLWLKEQHAKQIPVISDYFEKAVKVSSMYSDECIVLQDALAGEEVLGYFKKHNMGIVDTSDLYVLSISVYIPESDTDDEVVICNKWNIILQDNKKTGDCMISFSSYRESVISSEIWE